MDQKELFNQVKKGMKDDLDLLDRYIDFLNSNRWKADNCAEGFRNQLMMLNAKYSVVIDGSDQTKANPFTLRRPLGEVKNCDLDNEIDAERVLRYYRLIIQDVLSKMDMIGEATIEEMNDLLSSGKMPTKEEIEALRPKINLDDDFEDDDEDVDISKMS